MVAGIEKGWRELGLPENEPEDVARSILICATANRSLPPFPSSSNTSNPDHKTQSEAADLGAVLPFAGNILFVAGGQSYEIEDKMTELEPLWLGRGNSADLERGQGFLMSEGVSWDTEKGEIVAGDVVRCRGG